MSSLPYKTQPLKARLTQLRLQLWRAARLILDLKLNCGVMTFEECCRFLQEKLMFSPEAAAGEVSLSSYRSEVGPVGCIYIYI